jgi:hypothetical protein
MERPLKHIWTDKPTSPKYSTPRTAERKPISVPARLTWKDQRGTMRFATVVTRNVSELGVYVECHTPVSIPLYRLVQFQLEREARESDGLPGALRQGRVLSAVYRVTPPSATQRQGFALRLMVEPRRMVIAVEEPARATA